MSDKHVAQIGLLFVTIIWGLTFVMVLEALNDAPPFSFASLRFGLASILTLLIVNKRFIFNTLDEKISIFLDGFLLGVSMYAMNICVA